MTSLGATVCGPLAARAEGGTETRLREALRQTTAQLRVLEGERATWKQREATLERELRSLRQQVAGLKRSSAKGATAQAIRARLEEESATGAKLQQALAKCEAASRDSAASQAHQSEQRQDEGKRLAAEVAGLRQRLDAAQVGRARALKLAQEIIDWLSRRGGCGWAAREPFLGLRRVQLENIAQGFADRLYEERIKGGRNAPQ